MLDFSYTHALIFPRSVTHSRHSFSSWLSISLLATKGLIPQDAVRKLLIFFFFFSDVKLENRNQGLAT